MQTTSPLTPPGSIVHFEFTVPDLEKAQSFYTDLLGWRFYPQSDTTCYFDTAQGSPGGRIKQDEEVSNGKTKFFVHVSNIAETLNRASSLGATVEVTRTVVRDQNGFYGQLKDPFGNTVGLYSRD